MRYVEMIEELTANRRLRSTMAAVLLEMADKTGVGDYGDFKVVRTGAEYRIEEPDMTAAAAQDPIIAQVFEAACRSDVTVSRNADGNVAGGLIPVTVAGVTWWVSVKPGRPVVIRNANGWAAALKGTVATVAQADALRLRMTVEFGGSW
jgi:hypothetical protein